MKRVPLIIFGAGKVGRALVRQLLDASGLHAERDGVTFRIAAWCDSDGALVDEKGLWPETLRAAMEAKQAGTPFARTDFGSPQRDLSAIVDVAGLDGTIVVDVTATDATVPALQFAIGRGYCGCHREQGAAYGTAGRVRHAGAKRAVSLRVHRRLCRAGYRSDARTDAGERRDPFDRGRAERHAGLSLYRPPGRPAVLRADP